MQEPGKVFQEGDCVEFQNLVKGGADNNGKQGTIVRWIAEKTRYEVAVKWTDQPKKVKAENLKKVEPPKVVEPKQPEPAASASASRSGSRKKSPQRGGRSRNLKKVEPPKVVEPKQPEPAAAALASRSGSRKKSPQRGGRSRTEKTSPAKRAASRRRSREDRRRKSRDRKRSRSRRRKSRSPSRKRARHEEPTAQSGRDAAAASTPGIGTERFTPRTEKGKGVGKGNKGRNFQISKALARVLRHTAQSLGVQIRADGFCQLEDILKLPDFVAMAANGEEVQVAVQSNDKKRFETKMEADKVLIRAVQGHSMKTVDDDSLLKRLTADDPTLPKVCVHGTYRRNLESIQRNGLIVGGGVSQRNHVHFAPYEPHDGRVISGMRYNCEVAIYIDLAAAIREGVPFFQSANEVILSPGINGTVPAKFIAQVKDLGAQK